MVTVTGEHTHQNWRITHSHEHEHIGEGTDCSTTRHVHHLNAYDAVAGVVSKRHTTRPKKIPSKRRLLLDFMVWLGTQPATVWLNVDETLDRFLSKEA